MTEPMFSDTNDQKLADLIQSVDRPVDPAIIDKSRQVAAAHLGGGEPVGIQVLKEGDTLGNYRIKRVLGMGGQAVVYLAKHIHLPGQTVAIKLPHGEKVHRMLREAKVLSTFDHPNILGIITLELDHEPPFLVVDYCSGGSLADYLETKGPLDIGETVRICSMILDALEHAHAHGVVHRDLKPENILFDEEGKVLVADFGIGKIIAEDLVLSLTHGDLTGLAGTPAYLAPEQEKPGAPIDGRTDLYSFGIILYQMLTGRPPRALRPVSRERTVLDERWDDVIFKLTELEPTNRYPEAAMVRNDLENLVLGAPASPTKKSGTSKDYKDVMEHDFAMKASMFLGLQIIVSSILFGSVHVALPSFKAMFSEAGVGSLPMLTELLYRLPLRLIFLSFILGGIFAYSQCTHFRSSWINRILFIIDLVLGGVIALALLLPLLSIIENLQ